MRTIPGTIIKESRIIILIKGTVQGVGFRPFVYRLAKSLNLRGMVFNCAEGVCVEAEGGEAGLALFKKAIKNNHPPLVRIDELTCKILPVAGYSGFIIKESDYHSKDGREGFFPPDSAICDDCSRDIENPSGRFFLYPFTNCTNCGPRFTISRELPYDRQVTSMEEFPMCRSCKNEYAEPFDRRFHAQSACCALCGPRITLTDNKGNPLIAEPFSFSCYPTAKTKKNWPKIVREIFLNGGILALKSIGGFHLACNAADAEAVRKLRRRKGRESKPFAVMCRDLLTAAEYCLIDKAGKELLKSPEAPIVILRRRNDSPASDLPEELAPNLETLGVMLPYTPLQKLIFSNSLEILVMTSGNHSDLPLVKENDFALSELAGLADYFLTDNREIINRCDDSVVTVVDGDVQFLRRSRGYVPSPVRVPCNAPDTTGISVHGNAGNNYSRTGDSTVFLGAGGDMKSVLCLLRGKEAFLSQHLGTLNSVESMENYKESLGKFQQLLKIKAQVTGYDLHPDYLSSRIALKNSGVHIPVQHHHAHMVSCLAENNYEGEAIGVILDGSGYGTDGNLWGFEILTGTQNSFLRRYHLSYMPLPGGEEAVRKPWMTAVAALIYSCGDRGLSAASELFPHKKEEISIISRIISSERLRLNFTSGCGRLFDAVAAIIGVCEYNSYEGQAAVELGELVRDGAETASGGNNGASPLIQSYPFTIRGGIIDPTETFTGIMDDLEKDHNHKKIALRFHHTVADMVTEAVVLTARDTGLNTIALSGGCWHNRYLFLSVNNMLRHRGFKVFYHRAVPPGDGGICLGQAVIARAVYASNK